MNRKKIMYILIPTLLVISIVFSIYFKQNQISNHQEKIAQAKTEISEHKDNLKDSETVRNDKLIENINNKKVEVKAKEELNNTKKDNEKLEKELEELNNEK